MDFDLSDFLDRWRALFEDYNGYIDHATTDTLSSYASGGSHEDPGSPSEDLAGAARITPRFMLTGMILTNLSRPQSPRPE